MGKKTKDSKTSKKLSYQKEPDVVIEPDSELEKPVEPVKAEPAPPKPKPQAAPPVRPELSTIPLVVFSKISGLKWDQMAGFNLYAKRNKIGPLTVPEWREELKKFANRPTN